LLGSFSLFPVLRFSLVRFLHIARPMLVVPSLFAASSPLLCTSAFAVSDLRAVSRAIPLDAGSALFVLKSSALPAISAIAAVATELSASNDEIRIAVSKAKHNVYLSDLSGFSDG
jgi:hypothetical protein